MELLKTEIQRDLDASVTRLMREKNAFGDLQARLDSGQRFNPELWSALADLGLLCVPFSEELGGTGGEFADVSVVVEALGKGLCLEPYTANVVLCGSLLRDDPARLGEMLSGKRLLAFAHAERVVGDDLVLIEARAEPAGEHYILTGHKAHIHGGDVADCFIVSARSSTSADEISLFLVHKDAPGVDVRRYMTSDNMGGAEMVLDAAPGQHIHIEGNAASRIAQAYDRATAAICAEAVGAMEALVEATVEYVKTRKQFNTVLGSFQVVQHQAVDMLVDLEHARSLAMVAGRYADCEDALERGRAISSAKIGVNEAARQVAKTAVQLHGGIGMSEEHSVGHYFRRLTAIRLSFGDSRYHLERLASLESN